MGSLTRTTRAIIGLFTSPQPGKPNIPQLKPVIPLQKYLDKIYKKVKGDGKLGPDLGLKTSVPISIFLRSKGAQHEYAGATDTIGGTIHHLDEEEYFSASLIKVAAMFAAFKLRAEARSLIADIQAGTVASINNQPDFFNKLDAKFDPHDAVQKIATAAGIQMRPSLGDILVVSGFPNPAALAANFTADFRAHMRKMIIPSDNCSAGECIWRLSYPYINVKLMKDGYFDGVSKGIWLCGDYIQVPQCPNSAKKQPYVTLGTVNDCSQATPPFCESAQDTTSKQMARLFLQILLGTLVDQASSQEMRVLLEEGQQGSDQVVPKVTEPPIWNAPPPHTSYLTRLTTIPLRFDVDAVKVGFGPIKPDPQRPANIRSEGIIIRWKQISTNASDFDPAARKKFDDLNLTGEAAICWQNVPENISLDGVAEIINTAISNYVDQAPLGP